MSRRAYRLRPWLVRALIPARRTGSYVLFAGNRATYAGRSDTDLSRRLVGHARAGSADYFDFDVHPTRERAFIAECAIFHLLVGTAHARNVLHPATPAGSDIFCPFCTDDPELRARLRLVVGEGAT